MLLSDPKKFYFSRVYGRTVLTPLMVILFMSSPKAWAQSYAAPGTLAAGNDQSIRKTTYDLGVKVGAFLPYGIVGVRELLPNWGLRFGHTIAPHFFLEYNADFANDKEVQFYSGYISLRINFRVLDALAMHGFFGGDIHHYQRVPTLVQRITFPFETVFGYHVGMGAQYQLFGNLFARADVRMGFEPGRQVSTNISLFWRFGGASLSRETRWARTETIRSNGFEPR